MPDESSTRADKTMEQRDVAAAATEEQEEQGEQGVVDGEASEGAETLNER